VPLVRKGRVDHLLDSPKYGIHRVLVRLHPLLLVI
jgi:hypothetical protein